MRTVDIPPFLGNLLAIQLSGQSPRRCTCNPPATDDGIDWCPGDQYVFLGPRAGHFRRSNYSERVMRPAADGWHPARNGSNARQRMPVLVDVDQTWPGRPLVPWPAVVTGVPYTPPQGRGRPRLPDGARVASWLPIRADLTPHGFRHGYQTWMDESGVSYVYQAAQMGHEVSGMRGVYGHVSPSMQAALREYLQAAWEAALRQRLALSPRSSVGVLDTLLWGAGEIIGPPPASPAPRWLPKLDI